MQEEANLYSLVYVSSATNLFHEEDLRELLERSRKNNDSLGITGMLLYKDGNFIQAVEGPKTNVLMLEETITADERHRNLSVLLRETVTERSFPGWSMGFRNSVPLTVEELPGYSLMLGRRSAPQEFRKQPTRAQKLLLTFRDHM